jgi:iron complex outermembrane recepter protein
MRRAVLVGFVSVSAVVMAQPSPDPLTEDFPVVLTPTRLRQSLQDVPASVTVITAEMLRRYGIVRIPDALRLVPGMAVTQIGAGDWRINYHGGNILAPHRLNVMIDGISAYQPALSRVDWDHLPITLEDVDRIEVTRTTNSPTYGPNSYMAIINIITQHPQDVPRATVSATIGSLGFASVTGRMGFSAGPTVGRLSVSHDEDGGFDHQSAIHGADHDSTRYDRASLRTQTRVSPDTRLDVSAGYVGGVRQVPFVTASQTSVPDMLLKNYYVSATLTQALSPTHEWQLRASEWRNQVDQSWSTCLPAALFLPEMFSLWRASPAAATALLSGQYRPSSATVDALAASALAAISRLGSGARSPICGHPNQSLDERRTDIEFEDTFVFSDRARLVSGLGARYARGDSQTFIGGAKSNSFWHAFANLEYKPAEWLTVNAGAYAERNRLSESVFSPRLGLNFHLSPDQTVRLLWSSGTRTPDIQEQGANWTYTLVGSPPLNGESVVRFYQSNRSPGNLDSERIVSREVGYLLNVRPLGLIVDAKVFDDRLYDLISEKFALYTGTPTNSNSVRLTGLEIQANAELSPQWSVFANYAYLRNHGATTPLETTQYARNSGALGLTHSLPDGWRWAFAYYGASGNGIGATGYGRQDLTVSKSFRVGSSQASTSLILRRLDEKASTAYYDVGDVAQSTVNDRFQAYLQLRIAY